MFFLLHAKFQSIQKKYIYMNSAHFSQLNKLCLIGDMLQHPMSDIKTNVFFCNLRDINNT